MNIPTMPMAETIRDARELAGYDQKTLAILLDVSPAYINDIERGRRMPGEELLEKIAELLYIPLDILYFYRWVVPPDLRQVYPEGNIIRAVKAMREALKAQ